MFTSTHLTCLFLSITIKYHSIPRKTTGLSGCFSCDCIWLQLWIVDIFSETTKKINKFLQGNARFLLWNYANKIFSGFTVYLGINHSLFHVYTTTGDRTVFFLTSMISKEKFLLKSSNNILFVFRSSSNRFQVFVAPTTEKIILLKTRLHFGCNEEKYRFAWGRLIFLFFQSFKLQSLYNNWCKITG